MNVLNSTKNVVIALIVALVLSVNVPLHAEDAGFKHEESIRAEIFMELKSNVRYLYEKSKLIVPAIDTSSASKVAGRTANVGFVLPTSSGSASDKEARTVNNIN